MRFSSRTGIDRQTNALADARDRARRMGREVLDLTEANPTTAGLPYPETAILGALADPRALAYAPTPFGRADTREAIAGVYRERGVTVDPSRIVLTASTSEAYAFLFKLLCDDGDDVLVPAPSYPLFDVLARFEGVRLVPYPLAYDGLWHIDVAAVAQALTPRTRAVLMVSPNNPTGSYVKRDELEGLAALGLPLVCDEVFADYPLDESGRGARPASVLASTSADLVFALDGLSKLAALPQMKLAWIAVGGRDDAMVGEALERLELVADAFLSVGTPVQLAASTLLDTRRVTQAALRARLRANLAELRRTVSETALTVLDVEGGWYATVRLPGLLEEDDWVLRFLEQDGVYVHPGHFFDFADGAYLVLSLLTPEERFRSGVDRLVARVAHVLASEHPAA